MVVNAIRESPEVHILSLNGNTVGVEAADAIAKVLEQKSELQVGMPLYAIFHISLATTLKNLLQ